MSKFFYILTEGMHRNLYLILAITLYNWLFSQNYSVMNAFPNLSFTDPVGIYASEDSTDRLFVLEQPGTIKVFNNI